MTTRRAPPSPAPSRRAAGTYVALLRGLNVGGKNKVTMRRLAELFAAAGASEVRTYIQSGNVVFCARPALAQRIGPAIETAIRTELGLAVPVVIRSAEELAAVVAQNPWLAPTVEPAHVHVVFLATAPTADRLQRLDPHRSPPDDLVAGDRELYLRCPNGIARTRLTTAYFDSTLATTSTVRNWRTVQRLLELTSS